MTDKNDWLYEGQHGFRPGYSCESQVITESWDKEVPLDEREGRDDLIIDISKAFDSILMNGCLRNWRPRVWIRG